MTKTPTTTVEPPRAEWRRRELRPDDNPISGFGSCRDDDGRMIPTVEVTVRDSMGGLFGAAVDPREVIVFPPRRVVAR